MGLIDTIRDASEQAGGLAQRGVERVVHVMDDIEQRLRRRMRVYPRQHLRRSRLSDQVPVLRPGEFRGGRQTKISQDSNEAWPFSGYEDLLPLTARANGSEHELGFSKRHHPGPMQNEEKEETRRKPIVSIDGKDLEEPGRDRAA